MLALFIILSAVITVCLVWAAIDDNFLASAEVKRAKVRAGIRNFLFGVSLMGCIWIIWGVSNPRAIDYLRGRCTPKITFEQIGDSISTPIDTSFVWGGPIKVYSLEDTEE